MIPSQTHCSPLYPLYFMKYEKDACKIDPVFDPFEPNCIVFLLEISAD